MTKRARDTEQQLDSEGDQEMSVNGIVAAVRKMIDSPYIDLSASKWGLKGFPAEELRKHGIPVRVAREGVGRSLRDHPNVSLQFRIKEGVPDGDTDGDTHDQTALSDLEVEHQETQGHLYNIIYQFKNRFRNHKPLLKS